MCIMQVKLAIFIQSMISALRTLVIKDISLFWVLYLPSVLCVLVSISLIFFNINISSLKIKNGLM